MRTVKQQLKGLERRLAAFVGKNHKMAYFPYELVVKEVPAAPKP